MTAEAEGGRDPPAARGSDPVVTAEGVSHSFGDVGVLDGVDLTLSRGTVTALVGANGSGKTTLLRIIAGLLRPDAGTVAVDAEGARTVGYLPQSPSFRSAFTVAETLSFYADLLPGAVDAAGALDAVGLAGVADRRVDALSGGMLRLLGIAQATLGDPPAVVLDEPTGDLDPRITRHVFGTLTDLTADGTTVLVATHNLAGAAEADRVVVLDRGCVVASGPPADLVAESGGDSLTDAFVGFVGGDGEGDGIRVRSGAEVGVAPGDGGDRP
jgi:ABC-type multidrug transport system ATPase subunit